MGVRMLTERDIDVLQYENSIVIGNSENTPFDKCDVLYEVGTDFASTFEAACELAEAKGIKTITLLQGDYLCLSEMYLDEPIYDCISIIGDGMPCIYTEAGSAVIDIVDVAICIDGVKFGSNAGGMSLTIASDKVVKLNNIVTEGDIEVGGSNNTITNSNIKSLTLLIAARWTIVLGNVIETLNDYSENITGVIEANNLIDNNIIDGAPQVSNGGSSGTSDLPKVSSKDNGKVLMVVNGKWASNDLPKYDGEYSITPDTENDITLETAQKLLDADIKINKIPYSEVTNNSGGDTVYIGSEV